MEKKLTAKVLEAIRVDREEHGHTLTRIMESYRIGRATAHKAIEGLDASKVQRAPRPRIVPSFERPPRSPLSKANLGEASRQMIAARMLQAGLDVYLPMGEDTPVDLLVLRPDGIALKCQCKTMFIVEDGAHKMPLITVRKWGPNSKAAAHRYTRDEVDFFLGYAIDLDTVFVFPFDAVARFKNGLKIWLLRQPVGTNQHQRFDATPYRNAFQLFES